MEDALHFHFLDLPSRANSSEAAREFQNDGLLSPGRRLACREPVDSGQIPGCLTHELEMFGHPLIDIYNIS